MQEVFVLWRDDVEAAKFEIRQAADIEAMEKRLRECQDHQAESAKKLMVRIGAGSEKGLRDMCFHEWVTFHMEYMKNKALEDAVKEEERRIKEFMNAHKENAQSILNTMHAATAQGL